MSGKADYTSLLKKTELFCELPDDLLSKFITHITKKSVAKGNILFLEGELASYCYIVTKGWFKLFNETLDGTEAVVDVLTVGNIFGESLALNSKYNFGVQAVEDGEILILQNSVLQKQVKENVEFASVVLSFLDSGRKKQIKEMEHMAVQNAPQRIGCFLLRLCPLGNESDVVINLPYDKSLIASRLGMKAETFSRALNKLRAETGILIDGSRVEIANISQLSDFSCSACSSYYPCEDLKENKGAG